MAEYLAAAMATATAKVVPCTLPTLARHVGANGIVGPVCRLPQARPGGADRNRGDRVSRSIFWRWGVEEGPFHGSRISPLCGNSRLFFICEKQTAGRSVPATYALSVDDVAMRAAPTNIPGVTIDGIRRPGRARNMSQAVRRARAGEGPTLIECKTYRWRTHAAATR